jgi:type II secretory pathway pseudopilin PulG
MTFFIAGILALTANFAQAHKPAEVGAEMQIRSLTMASSEFEAVYGVFPPETNWSGELMATTNAVLNYDKVVFLNTGIEDPWGRKLIYSYPGKHNSAGPDVYSLGKDGKSSSEGNDPDDINNWNDSMPWRSYYGSASPGFTTLVAIAVGLVILLVLYETIRKGTKSEQAASANGGLTTAPDKSRAADGLS